MSLLLEWPSVPNVSFRWLFKLGERPNRLIVEQGIGRSLSASLCWKAASALHLGNYPLVHSCSVSSAHLFLLHVLTWPSPCIPRWHLTFERKDSSREWSMNREGALLCLSPQWPKVVMGSGAFYVKTLVFPVECKEVSVLFTYVCYDTWYVWLVRCIYMSYALLYCYK